MIELRSQEAVKFVNDKWAVIAHINVDTIDELPEPDYMEGKTLYQGTTAFIIKLGEMAVLSGDGRWYIDDEVVS